jgi:hypothetical protein
MSNLTGQEPSKFLAALTAIAMLAVFFGAWGAMLYAFVTVF